MLLNFIKFCLSILCSCCFVQLSDGALISNSARVNFYIGSGSNSLFDGEALSAKPKRDFPSGHVQLIANYERLDKQSHFVDGVNVPALADSFRQELDGKRETVLGTLQHAANALVQRRTKKKNPTNTANSDSIMRQISEELKVNVKEYFQLNHNAVLTDWTMLSCCRSLKNDQKVRTMYVSFFVNGEKMFCKLTARQRDFVCEYGAFHALKEFTLPSVYRLVAAFHTDVPSLPYAVVSHYIDHLNMMEFLINRRSGSFRQFTTIMRNLAQSIHDIHLHKLVHRDIKLENVIVHRETWSVFLIDFGHSCSLSTLQDPMSGMWGTQYSAAPEAISGKGHFTYRCDWYSYGACLFYGYLIFMDMSGELCPYDILLDAKNVQKFVANFALRSLILKLIQPEAARLADCGEILAEPFFTTPSPS